MRFSTCFNSTIQADPNVWHPMFQQANLMEQANARAAAGSTSGNGGLLATVFGRAASPAADAAVPGSGDESTQVSLG